MSEEISMPRLTDNMESGMLVEWQVEEGESVDSGQVLAEIESKKASGDLEAPRDGVLLEKLAEAGAELSPGAPLAVIEAEAEESAPVDESTVSDNSPSLEKEKSGETGLEFSRSSSPAGEGKVRVSPVARQMAAENDLDLSRLSGSGSEGRIIRQDVEKVLAEQEKEEAPGATESQANNSLESEKIKFSPDQQEFNRRLEESNRKVPPAYLHTRPGVNRLLDARNELSSEQRELQIDDFILLAASRALAQKPEFNVSYEGDYVQKYDHVNIVFAQNKLRPEASVVIENCSRLELAEIHQKRKQLLAKSQSGNELEDGALKIVSAVREGVAGLAAPPVPPQVAMLSIGSPHPEPVVKNNEVAVEKIMHVSLSCDQRAVAVSLATDFLELFKQFIEHPLLLLAKS